MTEHPVHLEQSVQETAAAAAAPPVPVSAAARMSIAGLDDESLTQLRRFFATVAASGTAQGRAAAPGYLAAIDEEIAERDLAGEREVQP